jgi:uncharacterized membrane protein
VTTQTPLPTKRPRTVLAGPYGHPFHPILITVPIGAWVASLVFDIAAKASDDPAPWAQASFWLIVIGIVGAALAAVFGMLDLLTIPSNTKAASTAITHAAINFAVLMVFAINALLRNSDGRDEVGTLPFVLTVVALAALGVSGWLGGKLSYTYGVRVADEGTQAGGYR